MEVSYVSVTWDTKQTQAETTALVSRFDTVFCAATNKLLWIASASYTTGHLIVRKQPSPFNLFHSQGIDHHAPYYFVAGRPTTSLFLGVRHTTRISNDSNIFWILRSSVKFPWWTLFPILIYCDGMPLIFFYMSRSILYPTWFVC